MIIESDDNAVYAKCFAVPLYTVKNGQLSQVDNVIAQEVKGNVDCGNLFVWSLVAQLCAGVSVSGFGETMVVITVKASCCDDPDADCPELGLDLPPDCKSLILRIVDCKETQDLTELLKGVQTWTYGKCELYHWIDALDRFDAVLSKATFRADGRWAMACDVNDDSGRELKQCVLQILRFTSLLIEHSFSRTVYNSMDYLTELLYSSDLTLLLENLHLLFMFSKRSNLLTRLPDDKRGLLLEGLYALAESWGGKEAGFGLAACCLKRSLEDYPPTATTVHMEFYRDGTAARNRSESWTVLHIEDVHLMNKSPSRILDECIDIYDVPQDKQLSLLTHLRLAYYFPVWSERVKLVQARLQALSILVYANAIQENIQQLLYSGLMEELVDILELSQDYLTDIKAAALRTLTSIIHLDRAHNFPNIIEATGAGSYHGFLPMMVRNCINSLTSSTPDASQQYPLPLATALFSFLYHLASYELGGEALVNCGMLESLLKVVNWETSDVEYITFVTRAVRVIDLITNMDMQAFQAHNGLTSFINRLEIEVAACRADQPFEIVPEISSASRSQSAAAAESDGSREEGADAQMETDSNTNVMTEQTASTPSSKDGAPLVNPGSASSFVHNGTTCLPQRAALLKSMLNFLKKVIQDPAFSDSIRHIMESSLPNSLKHIISNAEYYGASLFLLAIDVVTVYVFQEPSLLHSLQDNGLTDVITEALLMKDVPPTREVISSMPNVFSALCLNSRGLNAFIKCNPFQSLFKVLLSPEYLPAMRRRRTAEPMGDTASNLGNAMDELMRHQPSLKVAATTAIIQLLKHLGCLGGDTTNTCMKSQAKPMVTTLGGNARAGTSEGGSSDEEDDDDEEASTASHTQPAAAAPAVPSTSRDAAPVVALTSGFLGNVKATDEKLPLPLVDYILNVMKCVDAILSNNSTDDHCREFVTQQGLDPLLNILCLRILPIDFPNSPACQAVSSVCKSILNLAHEGLVLDKGLEKLHAVLMRLDVLDRTIDSPGSSVLLRELANSKNPVEAVGNCLETPILHDMTAVHSLIMMFIHVCRTGQSDIRTLSINHWGSKTGLEVLRLLSKLYLNLVWESTVLLALCSGEYQPDLDGFGRIDLDKLIPPSDTKKENEVSFDGGNDIDSQPIVSSPSQDSNSTMETQQDLSRSCDGESWDQMDVDSESNMATNPGLVNSSTQTSTKQDKEKSSASDTLQHYAKLLKPILSASSRLGRALAELFGLLVKLCVGSPLRQRRGHHMPAMQGYLSTTATQVAEVLAQLLNNGLKWQPKPNSPVPRLTFSICAVGFSAPLLFDEKKYPYHLMLRQFMEADGLSALFEVFYWAISESSPDAGGPVALPNEHQVEFLDSWLLLMEKFVNPKLVLESPHSLPLKSPILRNPFNANLFLANVHKRAFDAVMFLWRRYDLKLYGTRAVESMLAILCHILRYREQSKLTVKGGKESQATQSATQSRSVTNNPSGSGSTNDLTNPPEVNTSNPRAGPSSTSQLGSSGVVGIISVPSVAARSESVTAMATSESTPTPQTTVTPVEPGSQPTDDTTTARTTSAAEIAVTVSRAAAAVSSAAGASGTSAAGHMTAAYELGINVDHLRQLMDMGFSVEMCIEALITSSSLHQATDYLLNANTQPTTTTTTTTTTSTADPSDQEMLRLFTNLKSEEVCRKTVEHLKAEDLDSFTETIMDQCLKILDTVPESVYRVCELLVAVGQRNGSAWMEETLTGIVAQIESGIETIFYAIEKDVEVLLTPEFKTESAPVAHRIHLFSLMFEELKGMSAMALEKKHVIEAAIELIRVFHDRCVNSAKKEELKKRTPSWLAPLILMIDLYEKAAVAAKRRLRVAEETDHIWKWFDINSGKWCSYSSQNNYIIDKAFWDGESMVRITAGRRRYVINFTAMIQLNEETSNRRPITLWLKSNENVTVDPLLPLPSPTALNALAVEFNTERLRDLYSFMGEDEELLGGPEEVPEVVQKPTPKLTKESTTSEQESHVDTGKTPRLKGLDMTQKKQIVESTTMLMGWPVNPDALHAIMRLILRLTRSYEVAEVFSEHGGVRYLTTLTSDSGFSGFFPLANLLIRHVLEDSQSLKYAIEKMIRAKALSSGASTCKELHYLLRVLAPIACRHEDYFVEVAGGILRVDISFVTRRGEEDTRLIVKPISCKLGNIEGPVGEQARNAIETLLDALAAPNARDEEQKAAEAAAQANVTTADIGTQKSETPQGSNEEESMETDSVSVKTISKSEKSSSTAADDPKKKQLIPKYAICQLLAESVHSYSFPCKIIAEHAFYRANISGLQEDCTALAFLLDRMLPASENSNEKDCSTAVRDLISAMAGCNHIPDAQAIVISEVKAALQRALSMRESPEKHSRIQGLAALICTMIETCPSAPPTQMVPVLKPTTLCMNQVVRLLIRKNVTIDLARIPHSLDLSSPYMATTVNAALKPLEVISRIVNQPVATNPNRPKTKPETTVQESVNNTHTGGTSNSEMTHAQGEETVEDADNTEHDISAAAESLLDATSESHTHEHDAPEAPDDDVLDEIMDQLLERDTGPSEELIITENTMMDSSSNRMDTEQDSTQRDSRDFGGNQYEEDHDHNDTSDSESEASNGDDDGEEEGEEEEDEDEEEEDEDDDDEDGASNFDDRGQEEWDDGFMRFTGLDRDEDLLMVQYGQDPENTPVFFTNNATYNLNVGLFDDPMGSEHSSGLRLSHPLLQPPVTDQPVTGTVTTRGHRSGRQRRYQYIQFNPRHPHPPAILQRLLGPSTAQEVIQLTTGQALNQGMRDARFLVMDATADQGISRNGASGSSGCVSNYTALHWWCEEAKALDGESLHDSVVACKRKIVECIEYCRDIAFEMRREMKKKQAEEKQKRTAADFKPIPTTSKTPSTAPSAPSVEAVAAEEYQTLERTLERMVDIRPVLAGTTSLTNMTTQERNIVEVGISDIASALAAGQASSTGEPNTNGPISMDNNVTETEVASSQFPASAASSSSGAPPTDAPEATPDASKDASGAADSTNLVNETKDNEPADSNGGGDTKVEGSAEVELGNLVQSPTVDTNTAEGAAALTLTSVREPVPGPSGTQTINEDFRNILGDIDIPEGVDPSFLAALPEDMRQEVIAEHIRLQSLRARPQAATGQTETTSVVDVSPEFLAALPPNIQEEVLAQQRIEQQRRIATVSNPNDPMDTEAFFRNLQPSLRQAILADMEESQIAALPPDLAAEAQSLRREWESRNRQFLQDRLFSHGHHTNTTLSSILRNSGMRISSRYSIANVAQRAQWSSHWPRAPTTMATHTGILGGKVKGKQLVDNETLSCLLVLLFVDEPRLNTGRLHRVLRNLCYHSTTRQWVIRSLLSVMERANDCTINTPPGVVTTRQKLDHLPSGSKSCTIRVENPNAVDRRQNSHTPAWLNISLDAALGCRANVFLLQKNASSGGKKSAIEHRQIFIHPQAVPTICRHTLDVLSNLAKSFPSQFLPSKGRPSLLCLEPSIGRAAGVVEKKPPTPPPESKSRSCSSGKSKAVESMAEFWDHLLKLDSVSSSKKGKAVGKTHSSMSTGIDQGVPSVSFEASHFGQLISMFAYPYVRRSSVLTDKLLRLLSLISLGIPDTSGFGRRVLLEEPETPVDQSMSISKSHLKLIIDIITTKSCSEEGLEEATSLLLNLSYGPPSTRNKILELLTDGVRDLGNTVCSHIADLQKELQALRKDASGSSDEGSSNADHESDKGYKTDAGTIVDRFTKEKVIIQSASKGKAPTELQLPAMATLTSKSSSQAFFLRLLKVIINLRDAIRAAIKKHKQKGNLGGPPLMSSTIVGPSGGGTGDAGPSNAVTTPARQRDRSRAPVEDPQIDGWPMDVDMEPFLYDSMDTSEPRDASRSTSASRVPRIRRSAASEGGENNESSSLPPLVDADETAEDEGAGQGRSENRNISKNASASELKDSINESSIVDEAKLLPRLSALLDLDSLWETLSQCLLELGHTPDHHAVLVLQPAVEAFFLVHASSSEREDKKLNIRETREAQLAHIHQELPPMSPIEPSRGAEAEVQRDTEMIDPHSSALLDSTGVINTPLSPDTQKFLTFAETHRTVLNQILRQSTQHLADGPFSVLVDHTRVLDFDVKRRYFRTELERLDEGVRREDLAVHVRRSHVFEDSFRELQRRRAEEWKNRFYIVFEGEEGQDAGGLLREWYVIISREIFNPMYALFTTSPGDRVTYMINPSSHYNSSHLLYFKFVGRVIAKAIYDNKLLECYFTRSFYKHILGKHVKYTDMESEDYSFYQGLVFLMDHHISELGYDLTFSTEVQEFGVTEVRDLIPNGRNIAVTEENKMEYIRLVCQMKMTGAIRKQLNAFLEGFYDIIPKRLISIFNEQELELLISGLPNIDIEDLKANTEYHKYQPNSLQIQWFWRALRSFDQAERAKFLQFVTGTSKVPLQGFGALEGMNGVQKFQIHRDDRSTDRLPSAHTCFNQLDLPAYETYDKLCTYLRKAIHECSEGFGFA